MRRALLAHESLPEPPHSRRHGQAQHERQQIRQTTIRQGVEEYGTVGVPEEGRERLVDTPVRTEVDEQCPEREKLLREYTQCGRRLANLTDEQLAALKNTGHNVTHFDEQIAMAKGAEIEACRAYYHHVASHNCV
jgi:hypothetical protein